MLRPDEGECSVWRVDDVALCVKKEREHCCKGEGVGGEDGAGLRQDEGGCSVWVLNGAALSACEREGTSL